MARELELSPSLPDAESSKKTQLSCSRQFYNDAVKSLNNLVKTIPWMFFTGIASVHEREFYDAPEGQEAPPAVQF